MARSDEYSAVGGGGKLKLKGSKVKDGRVDKKKKKKDKDKDQEGSSVPGSLVEEHPDKRTSPAAKRIDSDDREHGRSGQQEEEEDNGSNGGRMKTEAERRYEEQKRKRLNERLKREGIKTHKERVEELNRYLSNLSEHHDMPKIGPG